MLNIPKATSFTQKLLNHLEELVAPLTWLEQALISQPQDLDTKIEAFLAKLVAPLFASPPGHASLVAAPATMLLESSSVPAGQAARKEPTGFSGARA